MKRLILFLILCATSLYAETSPRRDSIRIAAFGQLGIPTAGTALVTTTQANRVINEAVEEVSTHFPAIEKFDTVVVYPSTIGGALASDFSSIRWAEMIIAPGSDSAFIPMKYVLPDSLFDARDGSKGISDAGRQGRAGRYYHTHGSQLLMYAKWAGAEGDSVLVLVAYYAIDDALGAYTATTDIAPAYRSVLRDWICYRLEYLRFRYEAGNQYLARYEKAKAEASAGK